MKRLGVLCFLVSLLLAWASPLYAMGTASIKTPAEGATVTSPVLLEFDPGYSGGRALRLEVARGHNATAGFMEGNAILGLDVGNRIRWDAAGYNPGPYTLRLSVLNSTTREVMAQGARNVVLVGPNYSPKVSLSVPDKVGGDMFIQGKVEDTDLTEWSLVALDEAGGAYPIGSGEKSAPFPILMNAAALKDGSYLLRLTARDRVGQEGVVERRIQVVNPAPTVQVENQVVDPVLTPISVAYVSGTPAKVTVTVKDDAGRPMVSESTQSPLREGVAKVRINFGGMAAGRYVATATVEDQLGRIGVGTFTLQVREALPAAVLTAPAFAEEEFHVHVVLPAGQSFVRMERVEGSQAGTQVVLMSALPVVQSFDFPVAQKSEGWYSYRFVLTTAEGRRSESNEVKVIVDRTAPGLGKVAVAPVDGQGINMRWSPATDAVGIGGYEVVLVNGAQEKVLAKLGPGETSYFVSLPEGEYKAVLVAVDLAGHRSVSDLLAFRVQAGAVALMRAGSYLASDVPGFVEEGRTWVPLRLFSQALGYSVTWDNAKQAATILDEKSGRSVVATVGDKLLRVTGQEGPFTTEIAAPPRLMGGRVLVPLRALVEAFGAKVQWHGELQTVELLSE